MNRQVIQLNKPQADICHLWKQHEIVDEDNLIAKIFHNETDT